MLEPIFESMVSAITLTMSTTFLHRVA